MEKNSIWSGRTGSVVLFTGGFVVSIALLAGVSMLPKPSEVMLPATGLTLTFLVLLIWLPAIHCPAPLTLVTAIIAEASLYTYLTHYQVYAVFGDGHRALGVVASIIAGVALTYLVTLLRMRIREVSIARHGSRRSRSPDPPDDQTRSAISPSCASVAAMAPSARIRLAVTTPRPRAAAGDLDSSRFHWSARTGR